MSSSEKIIRSHSNPNFADIENNSVLDQRILFPFTPKNICNCISACMHVKSLSLIVLAIHFFSSISCDAQIYSDEDVQICESKFQLAVDKNLKSFPFNEVIVEIGKSFTGTDYETHSLEKNGEEKLVINLTGLDCFTFLENALVLSRCIKQGNTSFDDYINELTLIRYREGTINQYPSRLHYFTDWIYDNQEKGILEDVTKKLGGERLELNLRFMSNHPQYYKQLKDNPDFIKEIKKQEEEINKREYYFIPKGKIARIEDKIEDGDLLAFTSTIEGLDVNHVGIAVRMNNGRIHVLHAPNVGYKVQITDKPLSEYLMGIKKDSGLIVAKALQP
jgi:hypothetical protein